EGDPELAEVAERLDGALGEAREERRQLLREEPAAERDPAREGEVVHGDHRGDARVAVRPEDVAVVVPRGRIELARLPLDARPLDGEPVGAHAEPRLERDVLAEAVELVA